LQGVNPDCPKESPITIAKCLQCHVLWSKSQGILPPNDLYPASYYGKPSKGSRFIKHLIGVYQAERQWKLNIKKKSKIKILDIGCGDGTFLEHLPEYFEKFGYEPSNAGKNILPSKKDIQLCPTLDSSNEIAEFDLITFWQSLEHIVEPNAVLRSAHCLLKDEGVLFISVPNIDSWQAKIFRGKWFHLDPIRHLLHYTPTTLTRLLRQNGFNPLSFDTVSWEYGLFGWWQSLYNISGFQFNMLYKTLKRGQSYAHTSKNLLALTAQILLALPFMIISLIMFGLENMFRQGGVINLKAQKREREYN